MIPCKYNVQIYLVGLFLKDKTPTIIASNQLLTAALGMAVAMGYGNGDMATVSFYVTSFVEVLSLRKERGAFLFPPLPTRPPICVPL